MRGPLGINWCAGFFFFFLRSRSGMTLHQRDRWRPAPCGSMRLQQEPETNIFHSKGTSKPCKDRDVDIHDLFFWQWQGWFAFYTPPPPPLLTAYCCEECFISCLRGVCTELTHLNDWYDFIVRILDWKNKWEKRESERVINEFCPGCWHVCSRWTKHFTKSALVKRHYLKKTNARWHLPHVHETFITDA